MSLQGNGGPPNKKQKLTSDASQTQTDNQPNEQNILEQIKMWESWLNLAKKERYNDYI